MPFFCVLKAFWRDFCILVPANLIEKNCIGSANNTGICAY